MKSLDELPIEEVKLEDIKGFHSLALLNPKMSKEDFDRLKQSMKSIGYVTRAITLFRGKIVDGRHRFEASVSLGFESIPCKIIPHKTKLTEIEETLIMNEEIRRHTSKTQNACMNVLEYFKLLNTDKKVSQTIMAKGTKTSLKMFKDAVYIYKNNRKYFNALLDGNSVKINHNYSTRLDIIAKYLKEKNKEATTSTEEVTDVPLQETIDPQFSNIDVANAVNSIKELLSTKNIPIDVITKELYKEAKNGK